MRVLQGEQVLARIFVGEADRWGRAPLYMALVERLRREGFAGATVLKGVMGFGAKSVLHTASILRLSEDLPVVVEVVDGPERMEALEAIVEEMVGEGLVTLERVRVLRYAPADRPKAAPGRSRAKRKR